MRYLCALAFACVALAQTVIIDGSTGQGGTAVITPSVASGTGIVGRPPWGGNSFTYYVDSATGSDSNPGTLALPFQTVSKVNGLTLSAGQSVGFKRGGLWRETLTPGQSGSAGKSITFGAYGSGAKPKITGASLYTSGWAAANASSVVHTSSVSTTASGAAFTITAPSAGNFLVVAIQAFSGTATISSVVDNAAGGTDVFVSAGALAHSTGGGISSDIWYASNCKAGATTVTVTNSTGSSYRAIVYEVSGMPTSTVLDGTGIISNPAATLNPAGAAVTTANADDLIVTVLDGAGVPSSVDTPFGGFSVIGSLAAAYLSTTATGTYTSQWHMPSARFTASTAAFRANTLPNVWQHSLGSTTTQVLVDGSQSALGASPGALTTGQWFSAGTSLYLYSAADPGSFYTSPGVEAAQLSYAAITGNRSYITLDGLDFSMGNGLATVALFVTGNDGGSGLVVQNCEIHHSHQTGLYMSGGTGNLAIANYIHDIWDGQIYPSGTGQGISVYGNTTLNHVIRGNKLVNNFRGIFIFGGGSSALGTLISYNTVINSYVNGIDQFQTIAASNPTLVYNNTVIHNPLWGSGHGIDNQDTGASGMTVENNIIYSPTTLSNTNVELMTFDPPNSSDASDYNLYWNTPASTTTIGRTNTIQYSTFATWQTALSGASISGAEAHGVNSDPLFTNAAAGDYSIPTNSPAYQTGVFINGVTTATPNIGAN